jgi:CheY-like chemotaxis protein
MSQAPTVAGRTRVLVVDDEPSVHDALRKYLPRHDVQSVHCGFAAIDAVREDPPDVILLDLNLGDRTGFYVAEDIRAIAPQAQIIAISAHDSWLNIWRAFYEDMYDFMDKSYESYRRVSEVVDGAAARLGGPRVPSAGDRFADRVTARFRRTKPTTLANAAEEFRRVIEAEVRSLLRPGQDGSAVFAAVQRFGWFLRRMSVRIAAKHVRSIARVSELTAVSRRTVVRWAEEDRKLAEASAALLPEALDAAAGDADALFRKKGGK